MKSEKNIFIAFILNMAFAIFEFVGGIFTGSIAILSDSVHDIGDALSIGFAYALERKSKKSPDKKYTFGYARYSVLGGAITYLILIFGSILVIYGAIKRLILPVQVNYKGTIILAIVGVIVNGVATFVTRKGKSENQKAVSLHMLEDVLGWLAVLIGAIVMYFTNFYIIDPIISILIATFILYSSIKGIIGTAEVFLEKVPKCVDIEKVISVISNVQGVKDVHHLHVWGLNKNVVLLTCHIQAEDDLEKVKSTVKHKLKEIKIFHTSIEMEKSAENCSEIFCNISDIQDKLNKNEGDLGHCHHH